MLKKQLEAKIGKIEAELEERDRKLHKLNGELRNAKADITAVQKPLKAIEKSVARTKQAIETIMAVHYPEHTVVSQPTWEGVAVSKIGEDAPEEVKFLQHLLEILP